MEIIKADDSFAARFKEVRKSAGLNQREFGKRLGISLPTVTRIEKKDRVPDVELAMEMCRQFGCNLEWLILGKGSREGKAGGSGSAVPLLSKLPADLNDIPEENIADRFVIPGVPGNGILVRSHDDAMAPFVKGGDIAIVVPGTCDEGEIVLLRDQWGEGSFRRKRVGGDAAVFVADNREFPDHEENNEIKCIGTVVKIIRDL